MPKVALIIGHTPEAPGACNEDAGVCEYTFNEAVAQRIPEKVQRADVEFVFRGRPDDYEGLPTKVNATGADVAVSMHANAYEEPVGVDEARGTQTMHWHTSTEGRALAERLQGQFLSALHLKDRGVRPRQTGERGAWILRETDMPCAMGEPFFIDANADYQRAQSRMGRLASAYAEAIDRWIFDRTSGGGA